MKTKITEEVLWTVLMEQQLKMYLQKAWEEGHVTLHTQRAAYRTISEALTVQKVTEQMKTTDNHLIPT